jgi:hypothetical protein
MTDVNNRLAEPPNSLTFSNSHVYVATVSATRTRQLRNSVMFSHGIMLVSAASIVRDVRLPPSQAPQSLGTSSLVRFLRHFPRKNDRGDDLGAVEFC